MVDIQILNQSLNTLESLDDTRHAKFLFILLCYMEVPFFYRAIKKMNTQSDSSHLYAI